MKTNEKPKNVYELTQERLAVLFKEFDNIYVSFSGGKDSGVLLNLCIDYIRRHQLNIKLGVFFMDYEVLNAPTIEFVNRILEKNKDILDVYRVCVPFKVRTCTSMYQHYWRPWDEKVRDIWVREIPQNVLRAQDFDFFHENMWDYEFQLRFAAWLHEKKKAVRTACLVGIRTQESYNRWRTIYGGLKQQLYHNYQWTSKIANDVYNLYPIYDWKTTDIWTANGKFGWDYNRLYDLYYYAGVSLERQRVASPFISEAIESLRLYKAIEPDTWGRMIGRVNGVNFSAIYGGTHAMGYGSIKLPEGHTWKSFMEFLLSTLPEETRRGYLNKLHTSIKFWRTKGGCLSDETIAKLEKLNIPITVRNKSNYKTTKRPVMMEYLDDIDIAEFREIPTYKRMCLCILRNDYACKYMGFAMNKEEKKMKDYIYLGIIAVMFVVFLILHIKQNNRITKLMNRYEKFMKGKNAENLSAAIEENFQQMDKLQQAYTSNEEKMDKTLHNLTSTFHKLGIVKYDAFKEMGGNLSFALCMLDDSNTGFILNTMHGRDSSYTYIKEITKGESYATLGEEEKEALEKAMNS